ncbi:hypothetical protein [Cohnella abietis]|uniref:Uncharacterized protein n=1 Tax=Cohnella abietis TaxID=2507935 RepID=A0A3T1CY47_9BACL|nr:hypothetical protein [Cohnella abietis]BBI30758.1 hypothetical protein KCTCHS21_01570 [Cohnella abietis]
MEDMQQRYKLLVEEENKVLLTLESCDNAAEALFRCIYRRGTELDLSFFTDLINVIGQKQQQTYVQLLLLRLNKSELAHAIDGYKLMKPSCDL